MSLSVIWFFSATRDHLSVSCHIAFLPLRSATPAQCQSIPARQKPGCFDVYYLRALWPITLQKLLSGASVLLPNYDHMCFFMTQNQKQYFMQKWTVPFSAPSCKKVISIIFKLFMHSRNVLSWHFFFTPKIYFINLQNNSA